jgi:hypothetical protein
LLKWIAASAAAPNGGELASETKPQPDGTLLKALSRGVALAAHAR